MHFINQTVKQILIKLIHNNNYTVINLSLCLSVCVSCHVCYSKAVSVTHHDETTAFIQRHDGNQQTLRLSMCVFCSLTGNRKQEMGSECTFGEEGCNNKEQENYKWKTTNHWDMKIRLNTKANYRKNIKLKKETKKIN